MASSESVEKVNCDSCEFTEDCTLAYIERVRNRYNGMWLCGLCAAAVNDEVQRSGKTISVKEALERHTSVCKEFRASSPPAHPISEMGRIMRKSLDTPRSGGSQSKSGGVAMQV